MVTRTLHEGALFVGKCSDGKFTLGEIRCSNCNEVLEEEIAKAGEAYLVCNSIPNSCANPVKVFMGATEMHRWRDRSWEVIARICKSRRSESH